MVKWIKRHKFWLICISASMIVATIFQPPWAAWIFITALATLTFKLTYEWVGKPIFERPKKLSAEEEECAEKRYLEEIGYIGGHTPGGTEYKRIPKWVVNIIKNKDLIGDCGTSEEVTVHLDGKHYTYKLVFNQSGSYLDVYRVDLRRPIYQ